LPASTWMVGFTQFRGSDQAVATKAKTEPAHIEIGIRVDFEQEAIHEGIFLRRDDPQRAEQLVEHGQREGSAGCSLRARKNRREREATSRDSILNVRTTLQPGRTDWRLVIT
jgi:hypothetical protein